jgi:hypothetical protein
MVSHWRIAAIVFSLFACLGFSQEAGNGLSTSDYIAELDRLSAAAGKCQTDPQAIPDIIRRIPPRWIVRDGNRTYRVDCEWLKAGVAESANENTDESCRSVQQRIALLRSDAQALLRPAPDSASDRIALARILARREFRKALGPTLWDQWQKRFTAFLVRMLAGIFGSSVFPAISKIVVWVLVAIATIVLGLCIFKSLRSNARLEAIMLQDSAVISDMPWTAWISEAHEAAGKEQWRDAVHLAYWAGISFLESRGLWRPDRARTPREYLRLLSPTSQHRNSLSALTRKFETIWYGHAEAGPESFAESLKHLESLGCHSE